MTPQRVYENSVSETHSELDNSKTSEFFGEEEWSKVAERYMNKMREFGYSWLEICRLSKNIDSSREFKTALSLLLIERSPPPEHARIVPCLFQEKAEKNNGILKDDTVVKTWH